MSSAASLLRTCTCPCLASLSCFRRASAVVLHHSCAPGDGLSFVLAAKRFFSQGLPGEADVG